MGFSHLSAISVNQGRADNVDNDRPAELEGGDFW
jgi:hypothetical protein